MNFLKELSRENEAQQRIILHQAERELYRESLYHLAKYGLGYKDINLHTHGDVLSVLQSSTTRKLIVLPKGSLKSTIVSIAYPIWLLIKNPNHRILIDSELYTNSKNFLREIKGHLGNSALTSLYGPFRDPRKIRNWTEGEITIAQRTEIKKESSITCSGIGTEKTSQHYTVCIFDDPNSRKNSATKEGRQKVIDHYRMFTSLLDPGGILVVVGTRYAEDDLIGHIIANEIDKGISNEVGHRIRGRIQT